jgi:hypothetical protein
MLAVVLKRVARVNLSEAERRKSRKAVFEYELANGLLKLSEAKKKAAEFMSEGDATLDDRCELLFAFGQLATRLPGMMETQNIPFFLQTVSKYFAQMSDATYRRHCEELLFELETELFVICCARYYFYTDDGEDNPDAEQSCLRFVKALKRVLQTRLIRRYDPDQVKNDMILRRNFRFTEALAIVDDNAFDDAKFELFIDKLDEDAVMNAALQIIIEVQRLCFPAPSLTAGASVTLSQSSNDAEGDFSASLSLKVLPGRRNVEPSIVASIPLERQKPSNITSRTSASQALTKSAAPSWRTRQGADMEPVDEMPQEDLEGGSKRKRFEPEEDEALRVGYQKYGSQWARMLSDPELGPVFKIVKPRTAVNLKDRWRILNGK